MDELIQDLDGRLARIACDVVVGSGAESLAALKQALGEIAGILDASGFPGTADLAELARMLIVTAVKSDLGTPVQVFDKAWRQWTAALPAAADTRGPAAPAEAAPPAAPAATVEADVEALRMDPELSQMFIAEALDHLSTIEASVLELETNPTDTKILNDVFRPFHTVKGNSGALGVQTVQALAHRVENLLDLCRSGQHRVGSAEIEVILKSVDLLSALITDLGDRLSGGGGHDHEAARLQMMAVVERLIESGGDRGEAAADAETADAVVATAPDGAPRVQARKHEETAIKVDTRKLDNLVDMVGELVIVQSIVYEDLLHSVSGERLNRNLSQLRRITSELQRNAMSMRMVPIRQTFQKMSRLVRDLSKASGKVVELVLEGEDTELDRKVVEDINDPLMHMVRNSMDHGLESPDARRAHGKRAQGRLALRAYHESGSIVIEIEDDGGGLNTERIRQKAVERGLIAADAALSPEEIHPLIFQPGFSTADKITEISGRGVGMDVVRRNIEALRGRVDIESAPGQGTTFTIRLPLTLAIVDGLLLRVGTERYVLPTFCVRESLRPQREHVHTVQGRPCMIQVRDQLIPLVWLSDLLDLDGVGRPQAWEGTVVVIDDDTRRVALLVDELVGKQEVVIKSLGETMGGVRGVAGGAILGDGRIGLILDGATIVKMVAGDRARAA